MWIFGQCHVRTLKYGDENLKKHLVVLFNQKIQTEQIPASFKVGLTVTLHKGKNKSATYPNNYRAISLLPAVFKIFEKIVLNRFETIRPELKTNKL